MVLKTVVCLACAWPFFGCHPGVNKAESTPRRATTITGSELALAWQSGLSPYTIRWTTVQSRSGRTSFNLHRSWPLSVRSNATGTVILAADFRSFEIFRMDLNEERLIPLSFSLKSVTPDPEDFDVHPDGGSIVVLDSDGAITERSLEMPTGRQLFSGEELARFGRLVVPEGWDRHMFIRYIGEGSHFVVGVPSESVLYESSRQLNTNALLINNESKTIRALGHGWSAVPVNGDQFLMLNLRAERQGGPEVLLCDIASGVRRELGAFDQCATLFGRAVLIRRSRAGESPHAFVAEIREKDATVASREVVGLPDYLGGEVWTIPVPKK